MTWLKLPITGEFGQFLLYFGGVSALLAIGSKLSKSGFGRTVRQGLKWIDRSLSQITRKLIEKGRANEFALVILVSITVLAFLAIVGFTSRWPVVTEHDLRIEERTGPNQWWIVSDEHPDGFMYYACSDFDNGAWIFAGYYARQATWQVRDNCNSIRDQGFEFDYDWKVDQFGRKTNVAKTIKEAGY